MFYFRLRVSPLKSRFSVVNQRSCELETGLFSYMFLAELFGGFLDFLVWSSKRGGPNILVRGFFIVTAPRLHLPGNVRLSN